MSVIGGMFGEPLRKPQAALKQPDFLSGSLMRFVNARSALFAVLSTEAPQRVWLPSYVCSAVLEPVKKLGIAYSFYPISKQLKPLVETIDSLGPSDALIVVNHFGFLNESTLLEAASASGALIIDDSSQALLSQRGTLTAHYRIFSPRKFIGVPDGGILVAELDRACPKMTLKPSPDRWREVSLSAFKRRTLFDRFYRNNEWYTLFRTSEDQQPVGAYRMSGIAEDLLFHAFDYGDIAKRRRDNFQYLLDRLRSIALFNELPVNVVPLGFPIVSDRRDTVRERLFAQKIYPAIHWNIDSIVPPEFSDSQWLSERILTLPCDQRIDQEGLERIVAATMEVADLK